MPKYKLLVAWQESGHMEIEADTPEYAKWIAENQLPLPTQSEYVSGSFVVDEIYNENNELIEVA